MFLGLPCTRHRVFLAVLICAAKYLNDSSPKNFHWQKYGRFFSLPEVNLMERQLLFLLDYDLSVTEAQLIQHLEPFWASLASTPSCPTTPVAVAPLVPSVPVKVAAPALPTMSSMPSMRTAPAKLEGTFVHQQQINPESSSKFQEMLRRRSSMSMSEQGIPSTDSDLGLSKTPGLIRKASDDSISSCGTDLISPRTNYSGRASIQMRRGISQSGSIAEMDVEMAESRHETPPSPIQIKSMRVRPTGLPKQVYASPVFRPKQPTRPSSSSLFKIINVTKQALSPFTSNSVPAY